MSFTLLARLTSMRKLTLFKLWVASLCAVFACALPQSLGKTHEIGLAVRHFQPVSALSSTEWHPLPYLHETPDEAAAKAFIYEHESGNNQYAVNSIGACGLGQSLPCSKMGCALSNYTCQDAWFTKYAYARYGSWTQAKAAWLSQYDPTGNHYW